MSFIHDDFLLTTPSARELYHQFAENEPIYDYHCHLPPALPGLQPSVSDLAEIWLAGDHYKWAGDAPERSGRAVLHRRREALGEISGLGRDVPHTLRNPLYHWTIWS